MNLILGIDPGITKAYAAINLRGEIISIKSSKSLTASSIVLEAMELGRIVVVATDRKKVPGFVEKIAVKLGARIIKPEHDLSVREKMRTKKRFRLSGKHSGDALSAAFYAYKELRPLLKKISLFAEKNNETGMLEKLEACVVREKVSIKKAFTGIKL